MIKTGSDFSGVGAFDQALRKLGINYQTIYACDWDKYARQTYIENYGDPVYFPKDVYEREIPKESLDIYMTSPPCQAFSLAGNRKGENDKRGILFYNSHEFIKKNKPRYFIFENVKGLLSDDKGKTFKTWLDYLGKSINGNPVIFPLEQCANYHVYYKVLNSKDFGVPQSRERVFIVGIRDDADNIFSFPKEQHLTKKLKDILQVKFDSKYYITLKKIKYLLRTKGTTFNINENILTDELPLTSRTIQANYWKGARDNQYIKTHSLFPRSSKTGKGGTGHLSKQDGTSYCVDTGNSQAIEFKDTNIRRLTPRECFRLMDFPDTFKWSVSDTQAYKQAGNSIVVNVLAEIINKLNL